MNYNSPQESPTFLARVREFSNLIHQYDPNLQLNKILPEQQLFELLKSLGQLVNYDHEVFDEITDRALQKYGQLTIENYIKVVVEAEELLQLKSEHQQKLVFTDQRAIERLDEIIRRLNKQRQQQRRVQKLSNYLNIDLINITNLTSLTGDYPQPRLSIKLGAADSDAQGLRTVDGFQFQPRLRLPVNAFADDLIINVFDQRSDPYTHELIWYGQLQVPCESFPFFEEEALTFSLYKNGQPIGATITITAIIDVNDLDTAIAGLEERKSILIQKLDELKEDMQGFEEQLKTLREPFKVYNQTARFYAGQTGLNANVQKPSINPLPVALQGQPPAQQNDRYSYNEEKTSRSVISEQGFGQIQPSQFEEILRAERLAAAQAVRPVQIVPQLQESPKVVQPAQQQQRKFDYQLYNGAQAHAIEVQQPPPQQQQQQQYQVNLVQKSIEQKSPQTLQAQPYQNDEGEDPNSENIFGSLQEYVYRTDKIFAVWLILIILISLYRSMIRDATIAIAFLTFLFLRSFDRKTAKNSLLGFLIAVGASQILDIFWFITYTKPYLNSKLSLDQGEDALSRVFAVMLSYVAFALKVGAIISLYLLFQSPQKAEELQEKFHTWIEGNEVDPEEHEENQRQQNRRYENY